ncbi:MAG: HEAT repeat domain-containing protein, partial [Gemmataceae bacterium]
LRGEAFQFATEKKKDLEPLQAALLSQYADTRLRAIDGLAKKHTAESQQLLLRAVADRDKQVRLHALAALIREDAEGVVVNALQSEHEDVRVQAARALARAGLQAALAPLVKVVTTPEPEQEAFRAEWLELTKQALDGLAVLGDPAARAAIVPLLDSPHQSLRAAAADVLIWSCRPDTFETLRKALQHADPQVKQRAALGLAFCGDASVHSLVFGRTSIGLPAEEQLAAGVALGVAGEEQLVFRLDDSNEAVRQLTLLLLMLAELEANEGVPTRCLACLSSRMPRVRLSAARALEAFSSPEAFLRFVVHLCNDKGDNPAWKIGADIIATFARLIVRATPQTRARTAMLLRHLSAREQAAFDQAWKLHARRYGPEIARTLEAARDKKPAAARFTRDQLLQLAFGAYVGLVREQGSTDNPSMGAAIIRVRQTALHRILALAKQEPAFAAAARPVFLQALRDPHQDVRMQAFEHLQQLGLEGAVLGSEALETGHTDLGIKGLELLSGKAQSTEGQAVLVQVMQTRNDNLALEAAKLLSGPRGTIPVATQALSSGYAPLRKQAVAWLAAEFDKDPAAQEGLRQALGSRDPQIRERACLELSRKKDPATFRTLVDLLAEAQEEAAQRRVIDALVTLGDARAADAFLDRLENDPGGTALVEPLLQGVGSFRNPDNHLRLTKLLAGRRKWRQPVLQALVAISGFDQSIEDADDERSDRRWEEMQHPRRPAILARVLDRCYTLGESELLYELIGQARWARGVEVDPILALLTSHPDDDVRRQVIEAIAWRIRKRGTPVEPLLRALQHRDQLTQLLAAEGLARVGRAEGLNVLLASIDYVEDVFMRQRAVLALGESADARALDPLLRLANEEGHALQESAAEAIGHLGKTDKADDIFQLLQNLGRGQGGVAEGALKGLRWLDTPTGWKLIRRRAEEPNFHFRETAIELLGYNDDPATRDLLLRLLSSTADEDGSADMLVVALEAARRLWGTESLEPDYALLCNRVAVDDESFEFFDDLQEALKRVTQRGDARRMFEILPRCIDRVRQTLTISLLNRAELPRAEARAALANPNEISVQLAAHLLGRAGPQAADAAQPLREALLRWFEVWERRRHRMALENNLDQRLTTLVTPCLERLLWAAGRIGAAWDAVLKMAEAHGDDSYYRPVRRQAIDSLSRAPASAVFTAALERALLGPDPEVRTLAAETLAGQSPARVAALAPKLLADGAIISRLAPHESIDLMPTLRSAAGQLHYQGVALPHLIAQHDRDGLAAVVDNRQLPLDTRLGAVEGLARLADETAEAKLVEVGKSSSEPEELRKEAWRGLRRSKRARAAAENANAS